MLVKVKPEYANHYRETFSPDTTYKVYYSDRLIEDAWLLLKPGREDLTAYKTNSKVEVLYVSPGHDESLRNSNERGWGWFRAEHFDIMAPSTNESALYLLQKED